MAWELVTATARGQGGERNVVSCCWARERLVTAVTDSRQRSAGQVAGFGIGDSEIESSDGREHRDHSLVAWERRDKSDARRAEHGLVFDCNGRGLVMPTVIRDASSSSSFFFFFFLEKQGAGCEEHGLSTRQGPW
ncbi:hypothetical protein M0R45_011688 [Rubus argutus]|uniref:MHC class I antigen n=1 Tax=Rubus argutus TaxID=59490 RepID=A0AAW1YES1_RUBAR